MAEKLWDMANFLTGFAVAQALTMTFALTKVELKLIYNRAAHLWAVVVSIAFTSLYVFAIGWCVDTVNSFKPGIPDRDVWLLANTGRIIAVIFFTVTFWLTLLQHWVI